MALQRKAFLGYFDIMSKFFVYEAIATILLVAAFGTIDQYL